MSGYCGDCDKQIEIHEGNIEKIENKFYEVEVYLVCPWCDKKELITKVFTS